MSALLAVATGHALGPLWGGAVVWACALCVALLEFRLARLLGQPALHRLVKPERIARAQRRLGSAEVPVLMNMRLLPTISFNATNFALGASPVDWRRFAWTTALGILPMTVIAVTTGAGLGG